MEEEEKEKTEQRKNESRKQQKKKIYLKMENCCVDAFRHACSGMLEACVFFFVVVLRHSSSFVLVFSLIIFICAHFSVGLCALLCRLVLDGFSGVRTKGHMRTVLGRTARKHETIS